MRIGSLALSLALLVGLLGLVQAVVVLFFSYFTMSLALDDQTRHMLRATMVEARDLLDQQPSVDQLGEAAHQIADLMVEHKEIYVAVAEAKSGTPLIAFSSTATESLNRLESDVWARDAFLEWTVPKTNKRMVSFASASEVRDGGEYVIVLSADRSRDNALLSQFLLTTLTAAPFALGIVALGALGIVKIGLKPLNKFRDAALSMTTKNLSGRISPENLPSELLPLCSAFNGMLDRLDKGIQRLTQFSGDLAHEMRTPIATLLGRTQVALSQPRTCDQLLELLEGNVEELERLNRLVSDMLFLAQAENADAIDEPVAVDLLQEAKKIAAYFEVLALERNMSFAITGNGTVSADRGLVQRAITNLVSNAVRYADARTEIAIKVETNRDEVQLTVSSQGQEIPAEHHDKLFERFYRADLSRSREAGGAGLGLAIVKAIMGLHNGKVEVHGMEPGMTNFVLRFQRTSV
jgi:two-component system heavy metal sensor histidine kinase CusS